jgi:hypothetical protein
MINVDEEISKLIKPEPLSSDAYLGLHDNSIILKYRFLYELFSR